MGIWCRCLLVVDGWIIDMDGFYGGLNVVFGVKNWVVLIIWCFEYRWGGRWQLFVGLIVEDSTQGGIYASSYRFRRRLDPLIGEICITCGTDANRDRRASQFAWSTENLPWNPQTTAQSKSHINCKLLMIMSKPIKLQSSSLGASCLWWDGRRYFDFLYLGVGRGIANGRRFPRQFRGEGAISTVGRSCELSFAFLRSTPEVMETE